MISFQIGEEIANFLQRTKMLTDWLNKMENEVDKLDIISTYPAELNEQSSLLADVWESLFFLAIKN